MTGFSEYLPADEDQETSCHAIALRRRLVTL